MKTIAFAPESVCRILKHRKSILEGGEGESQVYPVLTPCLSILLHLYNLGPEDFKECHHIRFLYSQCLA